MINAGKYIDFFRKKKKTIIKVIVISIILFFMFFSDYGFVTTSRLIFRISELQENISKEEKNSDSLSQRRNILLNDSNEIERLAREHFGMIKPKENVFIIINNDRK